MATIGDPGYWATDVCGLGEALADVIANPTTRPGRPDVSVGTVAQTPDQLTLTVEETAVTLGISRAGAYDAVRRGERPIHQDRTPRLGTATDPAPYARSGRSRGHN
jgi:hypothetical protein